MSKYEQASEDWMNLQADLVVLAVPAPEAMRLVELPEPPAAALRQVGYDGRCAVALVLDHAIYSTEGQTKQLKQLNEMKYDII